MANTTPNHRKTNSVPRTRLVQPLPPLPLQLNDLQPQLSIATQIPYRDSPITPTLFSSGGEQDAQVLSLNEQEFSLEEALKSPPGYEPMYDYLRSRPCTPATDMPVTLQTVPYRDNPEAFIVTIIEGEEGHISISQPPPPSYNEIYLRNEDRERRQADLDALIREFDLDGNVSPAEQTEEIVKWVVAMLFIGLTVACVGTAFNWGR